MEDLEKGKGQWRGRRMYERMEEFDMVLTMDGAFGEGEMRGRRGERKVITIYDVGVRLGVRVMLDRGG